MGKGGSAEAQEKREWLADNWARERGDVFVCRRQTLDKCNVPAYGTSRPVNEIKKVDSQLLGTV